MPISGCEIPYPNKKYFPTSPPDRLGLEFCQQQLVCAIRLNSILVYFTHVLYEQNTG